MTRSIVLFTLMIATVASASAQNLEFNLECMSFKVRDDQNVWTYSVTRPKSGNPLVVRLEIPRAAYVKQVSRTTEYSLRQKIVTTTMKNPQQDKKVISTTKDSLKKQSVTPKMEYSLRQKRLKWGTLQLEFVMFSTAIQTITFEVIAPDNETANGEIAWTIKASPKNIEGTAPGPIGLDDPIIRYVLTGGYSHKFGDSVGFKTENNAVLIKYEGNRRLSFSAGLVLNCINWNNKAAVDLLLSAELGVDSSKVIDGFVGGLTFRALRFHKFRLPELFFGVSMRTEQKLRSGFKKAVQQLAMEIEKLPDTKKNKKIKSDF